MNILVNVGPGAEIAPKQSITDPVCIRVVGGLNNYNAGMDEIIEPPEPIYRIDVLIPSAESRSGYEQRNITLISERKIPPSNAKIGQHLWLHEPKFGTADMRAVSMLVSRAELVAKLRALADEVDAGAR